MMATKRPGAKVSAKTPGTTGVRKSASPTRPKVTAKAKPLSPGSNYPTTKNIQKQKSGFGNFLQSFQTTSDKSKYGVPILLPSGNINPAYLAAERKAIAANTKKNVQAEAAKTKKMKASKTFLLDDWIRRGTGNVGAIDGGKGSLDGR